MKRVGLLAVLLFTLTLTVFAQDTNEGKLTIIQDPRIDTLLQKYVDVNETYPAIDGWRIEIFFEAGNDSKRQAMEAKSKFVEIYPEVPSYLIFQQPYYKVRVGDYRTKMDAEKFLHKIEFSYPQAFVVADEISYPKLD